MEIGCRSHQLYLSTWRHVKHRIQQLIQSALDKLVSEGTLSSKQRPADLRIEHSRRPDQGDFATALALSLARSLKKNPRQIALLIQRNIPSNDLIEKTEIAGPGFINIFLSKRAITKEIGEILAQGRRYGCTVENALEKVLVEFVSANPTGPLHVGHGRGAAFGDSLARLLRAAGKAVDTEYYVNDMGRQMDILSASVWIRYLQLCGDEADLPKGAYQGQYIFDCAEQLKDKFDTQLRRPYTNQYEKDAAVDQILDQAIVRIRTLIGADRFDEVRRFVLEQMVQVIRHDLNEFDVSYDQWFFESTVQQRGDLQQTIDVLRDGGFLYESEGATWFRSSQFGDEKDRVLVRSNGEITYFASDIAYHLDKYKRGYNCLINIWGADHHGYIARMKAAVSAAGQNPELLKIVVVQFASLFRAGKRVQMSTRAGEFVTLNQLIEETGKDAARFFYVLRKSEQHFEFDLELAKAKNNENPVYYVQYAHARIRSVFRQMLKRGITRSSERPYHLLTNRSEQNLIKRLSRYPDVIQSAANKLEPHQIAYYLRDVANDFHAFYNKMRILDADSGLRDVRLDLIQATGQVLANGLEILGVDAPESM